MMLAVAGALAGELYFTLREDSSETAVRQVNGASETEGWSADGDFRTAPSLRRCRLGPTANPREFFQADPDLGYRLRPNLRRMASRLRIGGREIYAATISTGRFGWRQTPQDESGRGDVLFFGGTYVFGEELDDGETLPARFSDAMKGIARAHNFGVPGWGPQQALRLLELGGEKPELEFGRPTKAFFVLTIAQLDALAGHTAESAGSPRYEVRDGRAQYAGNNPDENRLSRLCGYSALCSSLRNSGERKIVEPLPASAPEAAAVFAAMQDILKQRYGIRLTVVSWNPGLPALDAVEKELVSRGIDVVQVKNALQGAGGPPDWVEPYSDLPTARATATLAQYLADRLRG